MEIDRGDVCRYLDFLRDEPGYCITLHGEPAEWPEFVRYNFHPNPYCHYVKTVCECWSECIARQRKVTAACRDGAFFGICYAGVGEYVYPLTADGVQIGFLSVSGYLGHDESTAREKAAHFARRYHAPAAAIGRMRTKYLRPAPPQETVDAVVRPLCHMLAAYAQQRKICPRGDDLYTQALRYITVHHHERLTMRQLSDALHCSVSTMSHLFQKNAGMSIRAYVEKLRLDEAEWLLNQSEFSVTEISDSLGFCSPAYFSTVFKKAYGVSPHGRTRRAHGEPAHK